MRIRPLLSVITILSACEGAYYTAGPGQTEPMYQDFSGTWTGPVAGNRNGVYLHATATITIAGVPNSHDLQGTWNWSGTLTEGATTVSVAERGSFTGEYSYSGRSDIRPSSVWPFEINLTMDVCPNYRARLTGAFTQSESRGPFDTLSLSGLLDVLDDCTVVGTYNVGTGSLRRG